MTQLYVRVRGVLTYEDAIKSIRRMVKHDFLIATWVHRP